MPNKAQVQEKALQSLLDTAPDELDEQWFAETARGLAVAVGADIAMIGRLVDNGQAVQTLGFCENRVARPNIVYELAGTPCADVLKEKVCVIPDHVTDAYPDDIALQDMSAVAYVGKAIVDDDRLLGIVNAVFRTPVRDEEALRFAFEAFSRGLADKLRDEFESWVDGPPRSD